MKAVSIGELTVDWLSLECGESMMTARKFYRYIGGNATNVAVGLARLGLDSAIISKVGKDIHADYLLACLKNESVDVSWLSYDAEQPTSQCYMVRRQDGSPDYYSWPSPNASKSIKPEDIPAESFVDSWIWHLAAVSFIARPRRFAMQHAVVSARQAGKIISFDACYPLIESDGGRRAAWEAMKASDIVRFNLAESAYWSGLPFGTDPDSTAAALLKELSPALLIITLAEKGAFLYSAGKKAFLPAIEVESVGDVGPGDAFSAGLIYGLSTLKNGMDRASLHEFDLETWLGVCRYGACTGAMVTRAYSATERFPRLDELKLALGETTLRS